METPEFNIIEENRSMVCSDCGEEVILLAGVHGEDSRYCKDCFDKHHPDVSHNIVQFTEIMEQMIENQRNKMTLEEMHELYGEDNEDD